MKSTNRGRVVCRNELRTCAFSRAIFPPVLKDASSTNATRCSSVTAFDSVSCSPWGCGVVGDAGLVVCHMERGGGRCACVWGGMIHTCIVIVNVGETVPFSFPVSELPHVR